MKQSKFRVWNNATQSYSFDGSKRNKEINCEVFQKYFLDAKGNCYLYEDTAYLTFGTFNELFKKVDNDVIITIEHWTGLKDRYGV